MTAAALRIFGVWQPLLVAGVEGTDHFGNADNAAVISSALRRAYEYLSQYALTVGFCRTLYHVAYPGFVNPLQSQVSKGRVCTRSLLLRK
jgi:hypothetical protein